MNIWLDLLIVDDWCGSTVKDINFGVPTATCLLRDWPSGSVEKRSTYMYVATQLEKVGFIKG